MINRIADQPSLSQRSFGWAADLRDKFSQGQVQELVKQAESLVVKYPGPVLAAAFGIGVTVAWLIKRR